MISQNKPETRGIPASYAPAPGGSGESSLGNLALILLIRRRLLGWIWLISALGSIATAFLLPKKYSSETTFQINTDGSKEFGLPEGLKMLDPKFGSGGGGTALALSILDSRKMAVYLIETFRLKKRYRTKWEHLAIRKFRKNFSYEVFDEGIVQIGFTHPNPDTARIVLDSVLVYLNRESILYSTRKARQEFEFNRSLVDSVFGAMDSLSQEVIGFMKRSRIVDFEKHIELSLRSYAKIQESLVELEGEYALARIDNSKTPQERDNLKALIGLLKRKQKMLSGEAPSEREGTGFDLRINYDSIPTMSAYMARIDLFAEKNKIILKSLLPKLEESRIKMVETTPVLNIIDPSFVPPYKSGPKRALVIALGTLAAGILGTLLIIIREMAVNPRFRPAAIDDLARQVRESR